MTPRLQFRYAPRVTEPSTTPETIGPYRVVRPVARGGMAAVYEVVEPETGRRIALKLLERGVRGPHRFARAVHPCCDLGTTIGGYGNADPR